MDFAYDLYGSVPVIKRYQVATSTTAVGQPWLIPAASTAGLAIATTTGCDVLVGCNLDSATYATAQQSDGSDPDALISVIINPFAVWKIKISGGATEDTALTIRDVTTAASDGLSVTTGDDWSSPTMDEGVLWGYDGANAGISRAITSVSSTAATVTVALPRDTVVGDNFLYAPVYPWRANTITLTTLLTQMRQDSAVATNTAAFRVIEMLLRDISNDGRNNSFALAISGNHALHTAT